MPLSKSRLDALSAKPEMIAFESLDDLFSMSPGDYVQLQLGSLQTRFRELRDRIPALQKLADGISAQEIKALEDAAPLLFQHTIYKSYPLALIERGDFVRLTRWLDGLTTHDLSKLDVSHIKLIDDWLQYLDDHTPLRVVHSSGTSGKLSFIPRSTVEMPAYIKSVFSFCAGFGDEPDLTPDADTAVVTPGFRRGFNAGPRMVQAIIDALRVPEERCLTLYPCMSADLMSLAGRLRIAEAKGEAGKLALSPNMQQLRERLIQQKTSEKDAFNAFFERVVERFRGDRVWIVSTVPQLYRASAAAREQGISRVFHPRSIVHTGGGMKGETLPSDFAQTICDFVGVERMREGYGMTESITFTGICPQGYYHVLPQLIPYLIDPDTGEQLPRHGVQSGRFGFVDVLAQTYWGGFLTGDYVTLDWEHQCSCGRTGGPLIHRHVQRLSEKRGGDDKISCAGGADEAHDQAVKFLLGDAA